MAMLIFLEINGAGRDYTDEELIHVGLGLADGSMDDTDLLNWILLLMPFFVRKLMSLSAVWLPIILSGKVRLKPGSKTAAPNPGF